MPVPQRCPGMSDRHSWRDEMHMIWCDPFAIEMHDRGDDRCASDKGGYEGCLINSVLQHGHARVGPAEAREPWGGRPGVMGLRAQKDPVDRRGDLAGIHQCFHGKLCGRIGLFKGEFADSLSGTHHDIMTCRSLEEGGNHAADTHHPNDDDTRSLIHLSSVWLERRDRTWRRWLCSQRPSSA